MKTLDDYTLEWIFSKSKAHKTQHIIAFYLGEDPSLTYGKTYKINPVLIRPGYIITEPNTVENKYHLFLENDIGVMTRSYGSMFCFDPKDFLIFDRDRKLSILI
jgi:hypothetical protein